MMYEQAILSDLTLSPEAQAIIRAQIASGRHADASAVLASALRLLARVAPAGDNPADNGQAFDAAELRRLFNSLEAAKSERDFIISLTARQRQVPHPEAIMQLTAEALGSRLGADRVGFYRVVDDMIEFGACWSGGRIRVLRGRLPIASLGEGYLDLARAGKAIVTENCASDATRNATTFGRLSTVAALTIPVVRDMAWTGGLFIHHAAPRQWSALEIVLAGEVAEHTWDATERADALRQLNADLARGAAALDQATVDLRGEVAGRLSAEEQVRQLQKMEAVGQLTGGIAHDFNNMLAVIIGGLNLIQTRLARGETDVAKYVTGALDGANRAATLTQRLLAFSRQQPLAPETLDANRLIGGMTDILNRTLGDAVAVETVLGAGLWPVWADAGQMESALVNLAVNARDAMPNGGRLIIETSNVHVDSAYARENDVAEGQYIVISVTDTGCGMTPEVKARAFEPFYTTKGLGKGTGLGLSQVFGFIKQSQGNVKIYSEHARGTSIKLYLPRLYGEIAPAVVRITSELTDPLRSGDAREIILVVEDEERVRNFAADALRELGYTVLHAAGGKEALTLMQTGQDVSLLFTDIVMPDMTGRELADQIKTFRPDLPVLYTTGFTRNAVVHNGVLDPGTNFLAKPFGLKQLAGAVRRALDQKV
jgi:signal transduction histidine kinase/ActR/RegA family two-component response regulator/Arc/MetJ-type ribon-helix-helix transcriptional regulator